MQNGHAHTGLRAVHAKLNDLTFTEDMLSLVAATRAGTSKWPVVRGGIFVVQFDTVQSVHLAVDRAGA